MPTALILGDSGGLRVTFGFKVSYDFFENLADLEAVMKHRPRPEEQDDLLRPRLADMIDMRHELAKLAGLIDWAFFESEWAGFFPSTTGRPATSPRLVAGLLYLQHAYGLSDEAVIARWVENPYYQHFTGETVRRQIDPLDRFDLRLTPAPPADRSLVACALA